MSTVKTNNVQVGQSLTATNNFTWYQPASPDGTIRLGVGNAGATSSDVVTVNSSGNVGIGTSSPAAKLDVNGAAIVRGTLTPTDALKLGGNTSAPSSDAFIYRPADNTLGFGTASTERMRIDSAGNVGIGTSSPDNNANYKTLTITGATTTTGGVIGFKSSDGSAYAQIFNDSNGFALKNNSSTPLTLYTGGIEKARIDSSGNVLVGTTSAATPPTGYVSSANNSQFRNRIINGAMQIAQRGTSFSTPVNASYTLDRWFVQYGTAAPASIAQVAGPTGFRNALQITGGAGNTTTFISQRIESNNCSDLSGATITIQANIAVSSAQSVSWVLYYANAQDNWAASTAITSGAWSATSTATTFTATVTGLPSGATNGLWLLFYPNGGSAFTSGTFTITGVQLEKGPVATPFDWRPQGTELALCQRYYEIFEVQNARYLIGFYQESAYIYVPISFLVSKRAGPTVTSPAASTYDVWAVGPPSALAVPNTTTSNALLRFSSSGTNYYSYGLSSSSSTPIQISAEL